MGTGHQTPYTPLAMSETQSQFKFLRDSAVITTGLTVLLFVWGSSFQSFSAQMEGVPLVFLPELTVQEHMMSGGLIALLILFPLVLLCLIIDRLMKRRLESYVRRRAKQNPADALIYYALALALSIGVLYPVAWAFARFRPPYSLRVKTMRLAGGASSDQFKNLYFVTRRGGNYVFVDRTRPQAPVVSILHVDEMRDMTLGPDDPKTNATPSP